MGSDTISVSKIKPVWSDTWTKEKAIDYFRLDDPTIDTGMFSVNDEGNLYLRLEDDAVNLLDIVREYGSPLEIMVPSIIGDRVERLYSAFGKAISDNRYGGTFTHCYPLKSNPHAEFVKNISDSGSYLEAGSLNELLTVASFYKEKGLKKRVTVCNGIKDEVYIDTIISLVEDDYNIIDIIESADEVEKIRRCLDDRQYDGKINIGVRAKLEVKTNGHWDASGLENRFGLFHDELCSVADSINKDSRLNLSVLHYHLGSQIEDADVIIKGIESIVDLYSDIRKICPTLNTIDIGGGFAAAYDSVEVCDVDTLSSQIIKTLKECCKKKNVDEPNLIVESGRWVSAPAQITVFKIIEDKKITNGNNGNCMADDWYIIDGSFMVDLLDTWSIKQSWSVVPLNNLNISPEHHNKVWLAGTTCDSDDRYIHERNGGYLMLPELGDTPQYIAVFNTGAYQDTLSGLGGGHYCMLPEACKVAIKDDGSVDVIVERQRPEDVRRLFGWDF